MKILITGGTGFLGRHLVWRAAAEGAQVVFTGRNATAAQEVMRLAPRPVVWQALEHGMPDAAASLRTLAQGTDALIHCAALSAPWGTPEVFHRANVVSTQEVLDAGHAAGTRRLIHVSTPSLYFGFADRLDIREDAALPPPANEYVRTKTLAETLVRQQPLPETVIVRPRALFGAWDQTLVPRLLRVMQRGALPLMRGGNISMDLTYIDNAVEAIWLALTRPLPRPLANYNITNGEPRQLQDMLAIMAREFRLPLRTRRVPWWLIDNVARLLELHARWGDGREPLLTRYSAGVMAFSQTLNIDALRNELSYCPQVSIEEGIRRHAAWLRGDQMGSNR
ncbi:NAD(P)-dependent oxidoreductase [Thiothrix unzii]|jgi:nucleoside-diphosphate-sugar epimerase|uniref:NAD-dependent epimerase/dehydratase family protein n=1 Tax=Thiothrix unzii TaxID=111769 RepID=UPI002A371CAF|nr:NAD(P)-dependent oxidoreductase [Thiothrix unzii]MDX9987281.1 NAD(P)-dependent oxidoreductase [Thiothrix unzii]